MPCETLNKKLNWYQLTAIINTQMTPTPRVLLTIDYEPWFALSRRFDTIEDTAFRKNLDAGFTQSAIDPILELLGVNLASFYLVGEIAEWYPEVAEKITSAGHELGLHCQIHRPLLNVVELEKDLIASQEWRNNHTVTGYRAPMVGIVEQGYPMLKKYGIQYSSSIYAPAGTLLDKDGLLEIPVSSLNLAANKAPYSAPRQFNTQLLMSGEVPYGSSFMIGLLPKMILNWIGKELKSGFSPVIILHPYELFPPKQFARKMAKDLFGSPQLLPFMLNKSYFLKALLNTFPVSSIRSYLEEMDLAKND